MQEELIQVPTEGLEFIALWKVFNPRNKDGAHIFLTHGTFSNKKVCRGIASYLVEHGYTCWIMEWRNHGSSSSSRKPFNFETTGKDDIPLVLDYLKNKQQLKKIHCITHSGGGICMTIALINHPQYQAFINSCSFFGCQAFGAATTRSKRLKLALFNAFAKVIDFVPGKFTGSEENETYYLMQQWFQWNISGQFLGLNRIDYQVRMPEVKVPIFSIAGQGDQFIAPPIGCQMFIEAFQNANNQYLVLSKDDGFKEDYNHSRMLHSSNARVEVYPLVLDWLQKHS